jgi:hypothetical protein
MEVYKSGEDSISDPQKPIVIICTKIPALIAEIKALLVALPSLGNPSVRTTRTCGIGAARPLLENSNIAISMARCVKVRPKRTGTVERSLSILASRSFMLSVSGAMRRALVLYSTTPRCINSGAIGRDLTRSLVNSLKIVQSSLEMLNDESSTSITSACTLALQMLIIGGEGVVI